MELEKRQLFIKKALKLSKHFDTCICLASNNGDKDLVTWTNGNGQEIAKAIWCYLDDNKGLKNAIYEAIKKEKEKSVAEKSAEILKKLAETGSIKEDDDDE